MSLASFPGQKSHHAPPPVDVAQKLELTRGGDPIAREIFEALTYQPVSQTISAQEWQQLKRDLTSNRSSVREAANQRLSQIGDGPTKRSLVGARDAACLILATFGLTLEQIGYLFGNAKGHIARKIDTAAKHYREASQTPATAFQTIDPSLNWKERKRLTAKSLRWAKAIKREPLPARRYLIEQLNASLDPK